MSTQFVPLGQIRQAAAPEEQCDLCAAAIGPEHRHLLDVAARRLQCACQACSILFASSEAAGGGRRLVPDRCLHLPDFLMEDWQWESLSLPVNMAFFCRASASGRVQAFYPSPAGPTESHLSLDAWAELEQANPVLLRMEPDVEALLVNRIDDTRDYFMAPIDQCYKLVGLIRAYWRGLGGGMRVWAEIDQFFVDLRSRASA